METVLVSRGGTCLSVADIVSAPYRPPALACAAVLGGSSAVAALAPFQVLVDFTASDLKIKNAFRNRKAFLLAGEGLEPPAFGL